ncbi:MAG: alpha/beta hydrolase [Myxococcota bacterium]
MDLLTITEHTAKTGDHRTFYLAAGPETGPLLIFVHGWPELSLSWRHQLPIFGAMGFRAIAPDLRGYGRSTVYSRHEDYAQERIVGDMIGLLDHLGAERAVFIGHDWGSPVVWNVASHHPERCHGVVSLCVPYYTLERGLEPALDLVDRSIYPEEDFPAGQWDYQLYYQENFDGARRFFEANPYNTVKLLLRRGDPAQKGQPTFTAAVRKEGGWFEGAAEAPDMPRDDAVLTEADLRSYAEALSRNGFFGPDSYYMNHAANAEYAAKAANGGVLQMPVLFISAEYDYVCECNDSRFADPMREYCKDLTFHTLQSGHWVAQEKPRELNAALSGWLATKVPGVWPREL